MSKPSEDHDTMVASSSHIKWRDRWELYNQNIFIGHLISQPRIDLEVVGVDIVQNERLSEGIKLLALLAISFGYK